MKRLVFFLLSIFVASGLRAADKVARWGRYEVSIKADVKGNPFDVELSAVFTGPDTTFTVRGFYDGRGVFKVRFMPCKTGKWSYVTHSKVSELDGRKGGFECVPAGEGNHGPVATDGAYGFKYGDGKRYYPVGTTSYDWMHAVGDYPQRTLRSLEKAGFNKIRMLLMVQNFDFGYPEPSLYPFELKGKGKDKDGKTVFEWDYTRFNPEYFAHVERCIDSLAAIGVEADVVLFHPYDDGRWNFDKMPMDVNLRYVEYVVARLGAFRNVWWSLANEYDFLRHLEIADWDKITRAVVDNDPYSHLCSIHSYTAKYYKYWMPEYTHASIQDQAPVEGFGRAATVRNIYKKPVIFDEVCYEGNMDNRWGSLSGQELLYRMWQGLMAGTYVTHGECYMDGPTDYSRDFLAVGGEFQGESWKRIKFMRGILEAMSGPLQLSDSSWDPYTSSTGENYYMVYLGKEISHEWTFDLPVKNAMYPRLKEGVRFRVEIIDTWNMTITEVPAVFETTAPVRDRVYDKNHGKVVLPDTPYLLLRITGVE